MTEAFVAIPLVQSVVRPLSPADWSTGIQVDGIGEPLGLLRIVESGGDVGVRTGGSVAVAFGLLVEPFDQGWNGAIQ